MADKLLNVAGKVTRQTLANTVTIRNESGSTILKGKAVVPVGYNSGLGLVTVDLADKDIGSLRPAIGVMQDDLTNNTSGEMVVTGTVSGLDTSAFSLTDQLVLGDNGNLIRPPPDTTPFTGEVQLIGSVSRVHATLGEIFVSGSGLVPAEEANWTGIRYFAVDYDGGSDSNSGYSDTSLADAGTKAIKTLEQLRGIVPFFGNGQTAVVAIKSRAAGATYRNQANTADDDVSFYGINGYLQFIVRGTGTVASASATAFANDTSDKICCGSQIFAGTNTAGYNPTGAPTTSVIDCVLAGGGAPGLSAEPALVGKRIRFDSATATVALRNATSMIWANTSTQITLSANLSTAPSTSDVFYIEEPGVAVNRIIIHSNNSSNVAAPPSFTQNGIQLVGLKAVQSAAPTLEIRGAVALANSSFLDLPNGTSFSAVSCSGGGTLSFTNTYTDEVATPNTITTGAGVRANGGITVSNCFTTVVAHSTSIVARFQILSIPSFAVGAGCFSLQGALVQGCGTTVASTNLGGIVLGNQGSATTRRLRVTAPFTEGIAFSRSNAILHGIDITGMGTSPCIAVNGINLSIGIHDVVGTTSNTGVGLQLASARGCNILMGTLAANTFAGAAGQDIQGGGGGFYVHADYARTDIKDDSANQIQGTGKAIIGTTTLVTNDTNANIGQYKVLRATGSGTVRAAQASTAANSAGLVGVSQSAFTAAGPQVTNAVNGGGTWIQFDAGPTAGNVAYLSTGTAGNAQDTLPAASSTNQIVRLGRVLRVSGTLGFVGWEPDIVSQTALLESVASAGDLTLSTAGKAFSITGTTTINAITTSGWIPGSTIILVFTGALTVKHNTAGGGGTARFFLSGSADFATAANSTLSLVYDGTQYQEISRKAP